MKEYYKITEVARLYGLCTDTLRYYEEQGLLHPHRSEAGYRLYSIDDICNLNVIRALRELDMPVEHMRRYFGERTVASTLDMLDEQDAPELERPNAATRLAGVLLDGDIIHIVAGTKINEALQDPNLPHDLDIRRNILRGLKQVLTGKFLKEVRIQFI